MSSRLDRLFILLESGSSAVTRRAAAKQIGEVQKLHPHELHNLLNRLIVYLHSQSWDTRIAAAQAVDAILSNVPAWDPKSITTIKNENKFSMLNYDASRLTFANFDLTKVLEKGARLMGSEGTEFDCQDELELNDSREHLNHRRALLNEQLGFHKNPATLGIEISDLVSLDDMRVGTRGTNYDPNIRLMPVQDILNLTAAQNSHNAIAHTENNSSSHINQQNTNHHFNQQRYQANCPSLTSSSSSSPSSSTSTGAGVATSSSSNALSCREINRARRKARQATTSNSTSSTTSSSSTSASSSSTSSSSLSSTQTSSSLCTTSINTANTLHRSNSNKSNGSSLISGTGGSGGGSGNGNNNDGNNTKSHDSCEPDRKIPKLEKSDSVYASNEPVPDATGSWGDAYEWPLESFCSRLYLDLFNARWETRHGAATALRELLKTHSSGAGKTSLMTKEEQHLNHLYWLEDTVLRLLCVLALDRFGDFISDQVVAPVRETCAQVLGTIMKEMPVENVKNTIEILLLLIDQQDWEVRHGGLLGIKYMLVVREDLIQNLLPLTINNILRGLFDPVDDVGAVAASTLIPIASYLPKLLTPVQMSSIVKMLWDLLLDQDELTSACNSFMGLLSAMLSLNDASKWIQMEPMSVLIPRLWPFLSHTTSSVRRSTLQTLKTLTEINTTTCHSISVIMKPDSNGKNQCRNGDGGGGGAGSGGHVLSQPAQIIPTRIENRDIEKVLNTEYSNLELNFGVKHWPPQLLQEALRHIYQRVLVEHIDDIQLIVESVWRNLIIHADLSALLHASCPFVASWMCLAMQPARLAFDPTQMIYAKINRERKNKWSNDLDSGSGGGATGTNGPATGSAANSNNIKLHQKMYLGGIETTPVDVRERNVPRARLKASKMLGLLSKYLVLPAPGVAYTSEIESPVQCYTKILLGYLSSRSALQRLISGMIISFWSEHDSTIRPGPIQLQTKLQSSLVEYVCYDEVAISLTRLWSESRDFVATLKQNKVPLKEFDTGKILTLDQIQALCTTMTENLKTRFGLKQKVLDMLEDRRRALQQSFAQTNLDQNNLNICTQAVLAGATVNMKCLPEKLNPVIKPIMESIKREECEIFQQLSAQYLVKLLDQVFNRNPSPNNKIITNLCTLLKSDTDFTPRINFTQPLLLLKDYNSNDINQMNPYHGILTLANQQKINEIVNANSSRGPGRPPVVDVNLDDVNADSEEPSNKLNRIQRIGATHALKAICTYFGSQLNEKVPIIWNILNNINVLVGNDDEITKLHASPIDLAMVNELITCLQLFEIVTPHIHVNLHDQLFLLLPHLTMLLRHPFKAIRHMASRCLATIAQIKPNAVMDLIISRGVALLQIIESVIDRQGAAEAIGCIVNALQFKIVPYVILLIVPLLGRMSDPDQSVRLMSTQSFATLIQLMPLDGSIQDAQSQLSTELMARKLKDKEFLEYLFTPKKIPNFIVPVPISAELRSYQQAGVNWLWFLNKYKLHGILCDDMGLGKTIQTICILAGDHHERQVSKLKALPSLVICPPTLTGHWVYEVKKFLPQKYLRPLHYVGLPADRDRLRHMISSHNLVVASYDIVRKDIDFFVSIHWNYIVLDEGHIIKNGKTKSSKAIKALVANHRLILSGTPIQNNVLELWSLFDFLMPGFLGTEKQFISKFSRPILASRDPKSSAKEQEAGALAMEALHRQVLPFLLRRIKEDVLTDLPPKITQDLLCELSPLQERLYEDFSKTHLKSDIKDCLDNIDENGGINKKTHVFQALRYLQNVCNHPKLVLTQQHPEYDKIKQELTHLHSSLDDIEHSAKLPALKQLLLDCGIGTVDDSFSINQHRALIFCQLKAMLDIVENDLLKKHLPAVSYLRLDGAVPPSMRHSIVTKFNSDPSIDVLLLTTQVGGLGLNLTGADTVIFVEHDWNPMKDLQAMDRAHRIGQRKVVNVYRLITRKSLEEKIMGLQKFKIITANTVVSDENASMETMQTDQLFDLFNLSDKKSSSSSVVNSVGGGNGSGDGSDQQSSASGVVTMKQVLETLPELWEDKQYEEEYDLSQFLQNLK